MNNIRYIYCFFIFLCGSLFFNSCTDDNEPTAPEEEETVNDWIYNIMDDHYLWYDELPAKSKLNFSDDPKTFFHSLLSSKDGKNGYYVYSTIESTDEATRSISAVSYGYHYALYGFRDSDRYYARVLYVLPGSPAEEAGLKRGVYITHVDGTALTRSNYYSLINSKAQATYSLVEYVILGNREGWMDAGEITIGSAREVEDTPFLAEKIFNEDNGKKIGYLMYNSFSLGKDNNDTSDRTYLNEMVEIFKRFESEGVNELILDMRYNPGGYVTCAQWLASMILSKSHINDLFVYTQYNDKHPNSVKYNFVQTQGGYLNLSRLYVIGTASTASASEAIINGLRPYIDVILVGETTEGKNVGSVAYTSDDYPWRLHPIVCEIYNSVNYGDYADGFTPNEKIDELDYYDHWYDFGDTREILLGKTLELITGKRYTAAVVNPSASTRFGQENPVIRTSIPERRIKGNILLPEN